MKTPIPLIVCLGAMLTASLGACTTYQIVNVQILASYPPTDPAASAAPPVPSAAPSTEPSPALSPEPTPVASASPAASPTPSPTLSPCAGHVTGGGRIGKNGLSFSLGPQIVSIDDPATKGVDYKADVKGVTRSGNMATLTAELRASVGMVTLVVVDNGEGAGAAPDTLTFLVDGVLKATGPVTDGNLQVHARPCE